MQRILGFIKRPTSKHIIVNSLGNYLNVFFTAFFALILVRIMNPVLYGTLSVLLGIAYVLASVLDFGTTATIYSYLPPLLEQGTGKVYRFIKTTFFYQSVFSIAVITVLLAGFPYFDKVFFKTGAPLVELYLTAFSVMFFIWQNFALNCLFAAKKFVKANINLNIANVAKTLVILFLALTHMVSVGWIIFVYGILGPAIFFILLFYEKREFFLVLAKAEVKREEFRLNYTLTYFIATQFYNFGLRTDLFLLSYFFPKAPEVGYYGLAQKVILTIITTIVSITQVLSPGFASIRNRSELKLKLKTGLLYMLLPAGLFILLIILPEWVYDLFFTSRFLPTVPVVRLLALPFIINALGSLPSLFLLYTVKKPGHILVSNLLIFATIAIGCLMYIPVYGIKAPPMVILVAFAIGYSYQAIISYFEYTKVKAA